MFDRHKWVEYIDSAQNPLRAIYTLGSTKYKVGSKLKPDLIQSFLESLSDPKNDGTFLSYLHYLANGRVADFLTDSLNELLRSATRMTAPVESVSKRGLRGYANWSRTAVARQSGRLDNASFIVRRRESSWDVPENRLLKLLLSNLVKSSQTVAHKVGTGNTADQVRDIHRRSAAGLKQAWLKTLETQRKGNSQMYKRAKRSRNKKYSEAANLQSEFEAISGISKWESIFHLISIGWFEPISDDDLFELYTLIKILNLFSGDLGFGEPRSLGLIKRNRAEVATFLRIQDGIKAEIYFDQSPVEVLGADSEYQQVLSTYEGIRCQPRRPDILIKFTSGSVQKILIIECKRSDDDGYMRDSVYKALGYLRDFGAIWANSKSQKPKIIVVFPETIKRRVEFNSDLALVGAEDNESLIRLTLASLS